MKFQIYILLAFAFALTVSGQSELSSRPGQAKPASIKLQDCEVPSADEGKTVKVLCGSHEVFENRATKRGRRITLKIVVFPATGRDKAADPVFYIPGGPGSSSTEDAPYIAEDLAKVREHRDLVFVDQRGTGGSNPLNCTFFDPKDLQSYLGYWNPLDEVRRCRTELESKADLRLYVTSIAADDLDDVRAALGYRQINLAGSSYGTRASQEYMRRHGKNVRTAFLHGISLPGQFMPRDFPQDNEQALKGVIEECAADKDCRAAFPDLKAEVKMVLATVIKGPVEVDVKMDPKKEKVRVRLSRDLAAEAIRYMLYQSGSASRLPLVVHLAAQGNFTLLAEAAIFYRQRIVSSGANGMYLSVTCAEDLPWIKPGEGERNGVNTFLGDYRLRQQREACALWPRGSIPKDYSATIRSQVPALIVTGQWDPVTPPLHGDALSKDMPNSLHIVVPSGGHGFGGLEGIDCISRLTSEFIEKGTTRGLDTSCVRSIRRKGFQLKMPDGQK